MINKLFESVRVRRETKETSFAIVLSSRDAGGKMLALPNRILAHFLDHFAKASGIDIEIGSADWPGSWAFDHVLCEDMGQLVGRGIAAIADALSAKAGIAGRASATSAMDDAVTSVTIGFESRPRCTWQCPRRVDIDGFVDSWYAGDGSQDGLCYGTNLRQFLDGFCYGSGANLHIEIRSAGNLHHLYETIFRNLGDAVGEALSTARRLPGESSGLAGTPKYDIERG